MKKRCPACGTVYVHGGEFCAVDGSPLEVLSRRILRDGRLRENTDDLPTLADGTIPVDPVRSTLEVGSDTGSLNETSVSGNTGTLGVTDSGLLGYVLADRYEIREVIGRGGMGVVYRAHHAVLDRPVAVKLLRSQHLSDEKSVQRFVREAQAMARVEHPNAVTIFDFGVLDDGAAYIVMEHIEGETLRTVLNRVHKLAPEHAVAIAEQVCGAVEAAHRQGVIHRDIKPENIMFKQADDGAIVKVVDFGLAKVDTPVPDGSPAITTAGDLFGTPIYMAPEYYEGETIGSQADIYSIGVVVYEMLCGSPPFRGTIKAVMSGHLFKEPPPLGPVTGALPSALEVAVTRALKKHANERFATTAEFSAALRASIARTTGTLSEGAVRLDTLRMSEIHLEPEDPIEGFDAHETPATINVAQAGPVSRPLNRRRAFTVAAIAAMVGLIAVGGVFLATPSFTSSPPASQPMSIAGGMDNAPADAAPEAPDTSGRPDSADPASTSRGDRGRAQQPASNGGNKVVNRMEEAPVRDEPIASAAPAPAKTPAVEPNKKSDDRAASASSPKNTNAKPAKEPAKKKKRWWNPRSWF